MSLKGRITLMICSIIIFLLVLLSFVFYVKSASIIDEDAELYMLSQLERVQENIERLVKIVQLETEKLALDRQVGEFLLNKISVQEMNQYLVMEMEKKNRDSNDNYFDLFILNTNGFITATCMPIAMDLDLSMREYFKRSREFKETVTSDILIARSDGSLIVITVTPIYDDKQNVIAFGAIAIRVGFFSEIVKDLKLGKSGYYSIVDSNNLILYHPNNELIASKSEFQILESIFNSHQGNTNKFEKRRVLSTSGVKELQIFKQIKYNDWILVAVLFENELYERSINLLVYVLVIGILVILAAMFFGIIISDKISVPIVTITDHINKIVKANTMVEQSISKSIKNFKEMDEELVIDDADSQDEISNLGRALKKMKEYFLSLIKHFELKSEEFIRISHELATLEEDTSSRTVKFISTLSHDLKTSITLIKGYTRGLLSGLFQDDETKKHTLKCIYNSAEDIERIICDILDTAYEARCGLKLNKEYMNSRDFAQKLFEQARQYIENSQRVFEGDWHCEESSVHVDSIKIKRVWDNLLSNAVKYSAEGSRVQVYIQQKGSKIEFKITDEGIGIQEDELDKIFNIFYRGNNNIVQGYGLGLFIAKSIIEGHGSGLYVSSRQGEGASVWFYLEIV